MIILALLAGIAIGLSIRASIDWWHYVNTLPPKEGYTVVTKNGKQFYRKLANKTQQTESGEAA